MHSFAERGTVHELILKGCLLERVMGENRTTTESYSWHGASFLVYEVSHCWGREFSLDYALLIISVKIAVARSPWLVIVSCCRILLHPVVSLSFFILFFGQSESNILRYLKPVLFINCHLTSRKFPIVILNFGFTPITSAGVPSIRTLVYHYTMVCLRLLPPCLEPNIFEV